TGAEVIETMPGDVLPMPTVMSTWPLSPKSAQGWPVRASTATSRASSVPSMMRVAQGASAASAVRVAGAEATGTASVGTGGAVAVGSAAACVAVSGSALAVAVASAAIAPCGGNGVETAMRASKYVTPRKAAV